MRERARVLVVLRAAVFVAPLTFLVVFVEGAATFFAGARFGAVFTTATVPRDGVIVSTVFEDAAFVADVPAVRLAAAFLDGADFVVPLETFLVVISSQCTCVRSLPVVVSS